MYIYKITNSVNGKYYIGQTTRSVKERWRTHRWELRHCCHDNPKLQYAWNKYGEAAFLFELLAECSTIEELNTLEIQLISENQKGYNIFGGGDNAKRPPEVGKKISEAKMGHIVSEDTRKKLSIANTGKKWSKEQKARHQEAMSGEGNPFFGKTHTNKTRAHLSEINTGVRHPQFNTPRSVATKHKISAGLRKYPLHPLRDPTGNIHMITNIREFAKLNNLDGSAISKLMAGKIKTHKGWTKYDG